MIAEKLFFVYFSILLLTKCAFLKILYGIDTSHWEVHYTAVLLNDGLSAADRSDLANRLGAALVQLNMERNIEEMQKCCKKLDRPLQRASSFILKLISAQFDQLKKEMLEEDDNGPQQQQFSSVKLCHLWRLAMVLDDAYRAMKTAKLPSLMSDDNFSDCDTLEDIMVRSEQNATNKKTDDLPKWVKQFREYFSNTHFYGLHLLLKVQGDEKEHRMAQWLDGTRQMGGESEFAHAFRTMRLDGRMERIREVKRRMVCHLMMCHFDLERLELMHPIRMAAGFVDEPTMRAYLELMFCKGSDMTEEFLEYAIVCQRIFGSFLRRHQQNNQRATASSTKIGRVETSVMWEMFIHATGQIVLITQGDGTNAKIVQRGDGLGSMHALWFILKEDESLDEKKVPDEDGQMPARALLLATLAQTVVNFYEENAEFKKCFEQQRDRRQKLRKMIGNADREEGGGAVPAEFWHLFEKIGGEGTSQSEGQKQQQRTAESSPMTMQLDICPDQKFSMEELRENERHYSGHELFAYTLMKEYTELMLMEKHSQQFAEAGAIARDIAPKAIISYYAGRVGELFKRAISGQFETDSTFVGKIHAHVDKWVPMAEGWTTNGGATSWAQKMCQCYQFVYNMVGDEQLMGTNAEWQRMVEANVREWSGTDWKKASMLTVGKIVLLSETKVPWHCIDCAIEPNANALLAEFRKSLPLMDMFHLTTLIGLLSEFDEMRSIFCHETAENIAQMKQRIETIASKRVLDRMEMLFPTVMHYDLMTNTRLLGIMLKQFEYQSGTEQAEIAEARSSTPLLISELLSYEAQLIKNGLKRLKNVPGIRELLVDKIKSIKRTFFTQLAPSINETKVLREALCPPLFLYIWIKSIAIGRTKIKRADELIEWHPKECDTEEGVKRAIEENRVLFKLRLCEFFAQNPQDFKVFVQSLAENGGAKTRFLKLMNSDASTQILLKLDGILLLDALWAGEQAVDELFYSDRRLSSLYIIFLTTFNSLHWLSFKLKLDLFLFVRWTDATMCDALLISGNGNSLAVRRAAKFWAHTKILFARLYDRWFDERMDEMPNLQIFQLNFLCELNLYLEKIVRLKSAKSERAMDDELGKIIQKSQKMYEENKMMAKMELNEQHLKLEMQLTALRIKTINELAQQNGGIKESLRYSYETFLKKEKLPEFVGTETIRKIWDSIARHHFDGLKGELEAKFGEKAAEEEPEINSKKKKPKRKKNKASKNKQTKEEEGGTTETEGTVITVEEEGGEEDDTVQQRQQHGQQSQMKRTANANATTTTTTTTTKTVEKRDDNAIGGQIEGDEAPENGNNDNNNNDNKRDNNDDDAIINETTTAISGATTHEHSAASIGSSRSCSTSSSSCSAFQGKKKSSECGAAAEEASDEGTTTKLKAFVYDQFLAEKYAQFVTAFTASQNDDSNDCCCAIIVQLIQMLNVGAFVNEISRRLEAIEWMGGHWWQNVQKKRSLLWWKSASEMDYAATFVGPLYEMLREILWEMDEIGKSVERLERKNDTDQSSIQLISRQIHSRKFGLAIVGGHIKNWEKMPKEQKEMTLLSLLGSEEDIAEFQRNLELLERADAQRELDQKIWEQYKSNENLAFFIEMKDKLNFNDEANSQIFPSEKWQELNSAKGIERKRNETAKLKNTLKLDDMNREVGKNIMIQLKQIFDEWSEEAQFQFPSIYFLKHSMDKFEPICILPEGFDQELIFGNAECDWMDREKCADASLHCALCKTPTATFLQNHPKSDVSLVPMLHLSLHNVHIEVRFVEIPQFAHIPRMAFSAQQTEVFLRKLGQNIHRLEDSDHFDEGVHWHEMGRRRELRREYAQDADHLEKFDKITELFEQSRAKALRQRELVKERKEMLSVLAANATHLKVLQFLLPKRDYLSILSKNELTIAFGMEIMDKFTTIFAYLKRWAQNNQIFCEDLGYLSEEMLLVMLTKVFVLFPASSASFLIDKFFLIYSKWKWPMPIQLTQLGDRRMGEFLRWAPGREWLWRRKLAWENLPKRIRTEKMTNIRKEKMNSIRKAMAMGVITPTFPERNMAENVNSSSAKVVQNELRRASDKIRRNGGDQSAIIGPIRQIKFTEKYEYFIVIFCHGTNLNVEKFCAFVGSRLRYELHEFVEKPLAIWVNFCHVFPKAITPPTECAAEAKINAKPSLSARIWLVGMELAPNQRANRAFKGKLKGNLQKKFDEKIKSDFENGLFHNVQLKSEMAERNDLPDWGIDPNL